MVLSAYRRGEKSRPPLSFVPPSVGMFVCVEFVLWNLRDMSDMTDEEDGSWLTPEHQFWIRLADAGPLAATGWFSSLVKPTEGYVFPLSKEGRQLGIFH